MDDAEQAMERMKLSESLANPAVRKAMRGDLSRLKQLMMATGDYDSMDEVERCIAEDIIAENKAARRTKQK